MHLTKPERNKVVAEMDRYEAVTIIAALRAQIAQQKKNLAYWKECTELKETCKYEEEELAITQDILAEFEKLFKKI